jgi:multidrug efflux system membrane fusion protein
MSTLRFRIIGVALLGAALLLSGCSEKKDASRTAPSVPVKVATASEKTVPVQKAAIGRVEPFSTVAVKAMVSGEILKVHFKEGDMVGKGDLLFTLDQRPYQAALSQAKADLAQDLVKAQNARRDAERYRGLVADGIVTDEQYEQLRTAADALEAAVTADRAAVENAKVQLGYCTIRSPLTGKTGDLQLHAGNIVKANADTAMVTINQITPIYVNFSVPEQELPALRRQLRRHPLPVTASFPSEPQTLVQGTVTFLDNAVDSTTGTILLKGTFANRQGNLWPGAFVNVVVTLDSLPGSVVVPSQAVQTGQQGEYVFVVQSDHTVALRSVKTGPVYQGETVVASGVAAGETVVTDGQLRLSPGSRVTEVGRQPATGTPQS